LEQLQKVLDLWKAPGHNLDDACQAAESEWRELWGEPTEWELKRLEQSKNERKLCYQQWQGLHRKLGEEIEAAKVRARQTTGRVSSRHQREAARLASELQAFEVKTQWEKRDFGPENKQGAPKDALL
jgi:hypothetical protein